MKKHSKDRKDSQEPKLFSIVVPFPGVTTGHGADSPWFDDCPICRDLAEQERLGIVQPAAWEEWSWNGEDREH